jgi:TolB protein
VTAQRLASSLLLGCQNFRHQEEGIMVQHPLRTGIVVVSVLLGGTPAVSELVTAGARPRSAATQTTRRFELRPAIAFTSTRDNPTGVGPGTVQERIYNAAELYLMMMNDDGTRDFTQPPRRLTVNEAGDTFPTLSPSGKQIVFESNRGWVLGEPHQVTDLYVAYLGDYDEVVSGIPEEHQTRLIRGASSTWSPDGKYIAFHASASGVYTRETLARFDPGTPTLDSDIFVLNVDDCIASIEECLAKQKGGNPGVLPDFLKNITKDKGPASVIDEDPDWSPDGETIVFTSHDGEEGTYFTPNHNNTHAEIYSINADATGLQQLTYNTEEERAPAWSPDGSRILYMCRRSDPPGSAVPFDLCVLERDASGAWVETQLTNDGTSHLTAKWSPDGKYIVFHRSVAGQTHLFRLTFTALADGTYAATNETRLTAAPLDLGHNIFASWGRIRVRIPR